jgi:NADPH:quinone reductase-like Zn-dependent oxidoreductase
VVDYQAAPFEEQLRGEAVDLVIDPIGGDTQKRSFGLIKKGGRLVALTGEPDKAEARKRGVQAVMIDVRPNGTRLEEITAMIDAGKIRPRIHAVLPLDQAQRAFEISRSGHVGGKIVLTP